MTYRIFKDKMAGGVMAALTLAAILLVVVMAVELCVKSAPILHHYSLWTLLTESHWKPMKGEFGFLPFIAGTFWCTVVAIVLALPVSLLMAVYLTEYARSSTYWQGCHRSSMVYGARCSSYRGFHILLLLSQTDRVVATRYWRGASSLA